MDEVKQEEAELFLKVTQFFSFYNISNLQQTHVFMHPFQVRNLDQGSPVPAVKSKHL
jgi:hypothetical protein